MGGINLHYVVANQTELFRLNFLLFVVMFDPTPNCQTVRSRLKTFVCENSLKLNQNICLVVLISEAGTQSFRDLTRQLTVVLRKRS